MRSLLHSHPQTPTPTEICCPKSNNKTNNNFPCPRCHANVKKIILIIWCKNVFCSHAPIPTLPSPCSRHHAPVPTLLPHAPVPMLPSPCSRPHATVPMLPSPRSCPHVPVPMLPSPCSRPHAPVTAIPSLRSLPHSPISKIKKNLIKNLKPSLNGISPTFTISMLEAMWLWRRKSSWCGTNVKPILSQRVNKNA